MHDSERLIVVRLEGEAARVQPIRNLDRPPIIMGHSFGGGFTQVLLDRGLGAAGVGVDSAPTKGVLRLPFSRQWPSNRATRLLASAFQPSMS